MLRATIAAVTFALAATPALAADNGFFLGASVAQGGVSVTEVSTGVEFNGDDTGFKLIAGFRPLDLFAIEVNYVDLGTPDDDVAGFPVEADTTGIDAFAVLFLPVPVVDIFIKAGAISWDQEFSSGGTDLFSDDGTDFAYGVGVGLGFGSLAARLEYERFEIEIDGLDTDSIDMISLGLTWTFL